MWAIIGIILVTILSVLISNRSRKRAQKSNLESLKQLGITPDKLIFGGSYLGGISGINQQYQSVRFWGTNEGLELYATFEDHYSPDEPKYETKKIGIIHNKEIKGIFVEDKSTSEKRLSIGNIALFGAIGLALRKTKNKDLALLVIKVNDGRFDSDAFFSFTTLSDNKIGGAFIRANECKSKLINHLKSLDRKVP